MSQAIQRGIIALAVLLVVVAGFAVFFAIQNKQLKDINTSLSNKHNESENKQKDALSKFERIQQEKSELDRRLNEKDREKQDLQTSTDDLKRKADDLVNQANQANRERDDWKNRLETIRKERDELMTKLQNAPVKIVYKDRPVPAPVPAEATPAESVPAPEASSEVASISSTTNAQGDEYWARILKEKAKLQVVLDKAKADLDQAALQVADLRRQNSELQLQINDLKNNKVEIEHRLMAEKKAMSDNFSKEKQDLQRKIKDNEDLASNLSMEVAHARGDQTSANDYVGKVKDDNQQLQSQVRQLVGTKVALEKTITRLTQEKNDMGKKLAETEGVIQDRINEIWQIKQTLDQKITAIDKVRNNGKEVELPPIVVNASGSQSQGNLNQPHKIISINEKNNFVILDYGESQGSTIGRIFKAYRNGTDIATLEVIQVRRDISAADIKEQKAKLQVGDQVR
ncbi:MAG: hypothetical protein WCH62_00500 [Candidatus Omnitrophota bacterium]